MFKVVTERRKRSIWSPRVIVLSVGAHLLLLGAFVTAAESTPPETRERIVDLRLPDETRPKLPPKPVTPPPPAAPQRDEPKPKPGDFVTPKTPTVVPDGVTDPKPDETPLHDSDVSGHGVEGDVVGKPGPGDTRPLTGNTDPQPEGGVYVPEAVTVLPHLSNEREAQRILQRAYPPLLRDAGVTGQVTVVVIIDENGNVQPGSVRVQDATNPAFEEAAKKVVERFRFTPAELNGHKVSVVIALPIHWELQQ